MSWARFHPWLADSTRFGLGKTIVAAGKSAGFDTTSKEGLEAMPRGSGRKYEKCCRA